MEDDFALFTLRRQKATKAFYKKGEITKIQSTTITDEIECQEATAAVYSKQDYRKEKLVPELKKQVAFRKYTKRPDMVKGASTLKPTLRHKYDIDIISDPNATPSKKIAKSGVSPTGDGDVWVEMIFMHQTAGECPVFFVSKNTGVRVKDEPPSGASRVIFLKESERQNISGSMK
mmetsp:Transcript_14934/g.17379  ORF Transcript_14934/g.17379 Transcript_14934/m.17379 type:complete len:175 (+) Transcript_14934:91-615(+)